MPKSNSSSIQIQIFTKLSAIIFLLLSVAVPLSISLVGYDYLKSIEKEDNCKKIKEKTRNFLTTYYLIVAVLIGLYLLISIPGVLFTKLH